MSSTVRQIAYRLKSEGKAEVIRDAREVGAAMRDSYAQAEAGANAASAASTRQEQRYRAMAQAARDAAQAEASQARYNLALGVAQGPSNSARESAVVFAAQADAMEEAERRARALRAIIDPLGAAQDRLNDELAQYQSLATQGQISTKELAQAQALARARFDEATAAIDRQGRGLSRLQVASRLNLARQGADVAVTAAMGMNPAMIAIQQGPQILDAMATSGLKLSTAMLLAGSAVTALAGGIAVAAVAWDNGEKSALAYERAIMGLGRTAGLTAREMEAQTIAAAELGEVSLASARAQAAAYVSTGKIGGEIMAGLIRIGRDYASVMSMDAEEATKSLAKAMEEPDKAARQLTRQFGLLDQETLNSIDSLIKHGDRLGAQRILLDALTEAVSGHADRVGEIETAWDGVSRSISNAWDWLGRYLYRSESERLEQQRSTLERLQARDARRGRGESPWTATVRGRVEAADAAAAAREAEAKRIRDEAAANQRAQEEKDRADAAQGAADRAAREARAAAERRRREAERVARETLQRTRREEDAATSRELEIARLREDGQRIQALQDEMSLRQRIRQLVDDEMSAEAARTQALREQEPLLAARWEAAEREAQARAEQLQMDQLRERGDHASLRLIEDRVREQAVFNEYLGIWHSRSLALLMTELELSAAAEHRAEMAERTVAAAERERQIALARASGNTRRERMLDREAFIDRRAAEIEAERELDRGEGRAQAAREWADMWQAEATGARREWVKGFADDLRRGGIGDAVRNQLEEAGDRFIDHLIDALFDMDWAAIFNNARPGAGGGQGGAGLADLFSQALNFFVGRNAAGTDFWRGGWTLVGEEGPELVRAPRGAQVLNHARSMQLAAAAGGSGGGAASFTFAPVIHAEGAGPREVEALSRKLDEMRDSLRSEVPALMRDALTRRLV